MKPWIMKEQLVSSAFAAGSFLYFLSSISSPHAIVYRILDLGYYGVPGLDNREAIDFAWNYRSRYACEAHIVMSRISHFVFQIEIVRRHKADISKGRRIWVQGGYGKHFQQSPEVGWTTLRYPRWTFVGAPFPPDS